MIYKNTNDWDDLEKFENVGARISTPLITINLAFTFTLSTSFIRENSDIFKNNTHVFLSYSRQKSAIVFQFTDEATSHGAIKMTRRSNISIAARSFFNYYSLDIEKVKGRYEPTLEKIPGKGNCWVIYLNKNLSMKQIKQ